MGIIKKVKDALTTKKEEKVATATKVEEQVDPYTKEEMLADTKKQPLIEVLKTIEDPELGIDIWTLGLIYNIDFQESKVEQKEDVKIRMTFTSIMCPVGPMIVQSVKDKLQKLDNVAEVHVQVTFSPVWEPTDELREMLGV